MSDPLPNHATVVFDGTCGFCTRCIRLMHGIDPHHRLDAIPCQATGRVATLGVATGECEAAAWVVSDTGERFGGAQAVLAAIAIARGWTWPLRIGRLPIVRQFLASVYRLVSRARPWLPGDQPWCETHPDDCRSADDITGATTDDSAPR